MTQLTGTGVVAGVAYAPARWAADRPEFDASSFAPVAEDGRPAELERLTAAIDTVADRYRARAAKVSEPHSKEVVEADAGIAQDRGLMRTAR